MIAKIFRLETVSAMSSGKMYLVGAREAEREGREGKGVFVGCNSIAALLRSRSPFPVLFSRTLQVAESNYAAAAAAAFA